LPLVVTGTLLTPRVMHELIRARVDDVVPKPFTPREIVSAVERVLGNARTRHNGALEYAAAMANARRAIVEGRLHDAEAPLARARAVSPLDGEAMALLGLFCELGGQDRQADRAYRAALALREDRVTEDVSPAEGLARLRAYGGARSVPTFEHHGRHSLWFVSEAGRFGIFARARASRVGCHVRARGRRQAGFSDRHERADRAPGVAYRTLFRGSHYLSPSENALADRARRTPWHHGGRGTRMTRHP
jgi:hypothetical protein